MCDYETEFGFMERVRFAKAQVVDDNLEETQTPKCEKCTERDSIYHVHCATHTHYYCYECSDLLEDK